MRNQFHHASTEWNRRLLILHHRLGKSCLKFKNSRKKNINNSVNLFSQRPLTLKWSHDQSVSQRYIEFYWSKHRQILDTIKNIWNLIQVGFHTFHRALAACRFVSLMVSSIGMNFTFTNFFNFKTEFVTGSRTLNRFIITGHFRVGSRRWNWKFREKHFWNPNPENFCYIQVIVFDLDEI